MAMEYQTVLHSSSIDFPKGIALPSLPAGDLAGAGTGAKYQTGYGQVQAIATWRCAWEQAYLSSETSKDQQAQKNAATELASYYDIDVVKQYVVDPNHQWYADVVTPALDGNTAPMDADVANNCDPAIK